jgi:hydroxymethylpyrimidine pyrophosphatase-like HAD family hydrolase
MQAIHSYYPAISENGAGLFVPEPYGFKWHPAIATATLNMIVRGIDKAEGVRWLARGTGIPLGDMAGVGDSESDLKFMRLLRWMATPANAHASVKQLAHHTPPYEDGPGSVDILARIPRA